MLIGPPRSGKTYIPRAPVSCTTAAAKTGHLSWTPSATSATSTGAPEVNASTHGPSDSRNCSSSIRTATSSVAHTGF